MSTLEQEVLQRLRNFVGTTPAHGSGAMVGDLVHEFDTHEQVRRALGRLSQKGLAAPRRCAGRRDKEFVVLWYPVHTPNRAAEDANAATASLRPTWPDVIARGDGSSTLTEDELVALSNSVHGVVWRYPTGSWATLVAAVEKILAVRDSTHKDDS